MILKYLLCVQNCKCLFWRHSKIYDLKRFQQTEIVQVDQTLLKKRENNTLKNIITGSSDQTVAYWSGQLMTLDWRGQLV